MTDGAFGEPTGAEVFILGITHAEYGELITGKPNSVENGHSMRDGHLETNTSDRLRSQGIASGCSSFERSSRPAGSNAQACRLVGFI